MVQGKEKWRERIRYVLHRCRFFVHGAFLSGEGMRVESASYPTGNAPPVVSLPPSKDGISLPLPAHKSVGEFFDSALSA
jgi:hypothetical protein